MALKVVEADTSDAPRAVEVENLAYGAIPGNIGPVLFPGPFPPDRPSRADVLVRLRSEDDGTRWAKVVDTDLEAAGADGLVAFTEWHFWTRPQEQTAGVFGEGCNVEACERMFGAMRDRRQDRFDGKPFAYLKLLHTHPDHQRRGAGGMLLEWGTQEADRLGLPAYLEATKEGKPLYEKYGFKEVELLLTDFSPWGGPAEHPSSLMLREKA